MEYGDKRILVLGAGASGIGAAWVLGQLKANVVLNDYKPVEFDIVTRERLEAVGVTIITGRQDNDLLDGVDRIIISPGISLSIPIVQAAMERHIEVVSEVELAYDICKSPILGITGTNGKTTTTTLLTNVMTATGLPVKVGGNIGDSLSEVAYSMPAGGYVIAELSSYQLETIKEFRALGAIILNVSPDHLARHKTMENYIAAKERIFSNQLSSDFIVLNGDDLIVSAMVGRTASQVLMISQHHKVDNGAYYQDNTCYAVQNGVAHPIIRKDDIHVQGSHNIENILAVIALTYALGVDTEIIGKVISTFHGVEHRLEKVMTFHDVTFYNDSKATNTDSVIKALGAFKEPVILLAGGHDKMTPLDAFMTFVKEHTKMVVLMGDAAERFEVAANKAGITHIHRAQSMKEAVDLGYSLANPGDIVLLSPACASFDWYGSFEERGEDFKHWVRTLEERS